MTIINNNLLIYGGYNDSYLNDCYILDLNNLFNNNNNNEIKWNKIILNQQTLYFPLILSHNSKLFKVYIPIFIDK